MSEPKYMMDHFRGDKIRSRCIQMTSETKTLLQWR